MRYFKYVPRLSIIGSVLPNPVQSLGIDDEVKHSRITRAWLEVVGEHISRYARPLRLFQQTLHVRVCNTNWMEKLNYQRKLFIKKLNHHLGNYEVKDLRLELGDLPPLVAVPPPQEGSAPWLSEDIPQEVRLEIEEKLSHIPEGKIKDSARRIMLKHYQLKCYQSE